MHRLLVPLLALILAGCATFDSRELAYLRSTGLPPPILVKLDRGVPLTPPEIITLTRHNIPDRYILRHLDHNGVDYLVTQQDILRMRRAGVSAIVIDAVLAECERFARRYAPPDFVVHTSYWWVGSPYCGPELYPVWW